MIDEEEILGLSFLAYRRMAKMLYIPAVCVRSNRRQVVKVDPGRTGGGSGGGCTRPAGSLLKEIAMQYLGGIRGAGVLKCKGETLARADYDFEGFLTKPGEVTGSGEIHMPPDALRQVFGREDLHLLTDDGRSLSLRFSEKQLPVDSDSAHVDVTGDLPTQSEWRH